MKGSKGKNNEDSDSEVGDLDDDEFDSYLDGLSAKKSGEGDVDFMKEMGSGVDMGDAPKSGKKRKRDAEGDDDGDDGGEDDWNEDEAEDEDVSMDGSDISDLGEDDDDDDDEAMTFSESDGDDEDGPKGGKRGAMVSEKEFNRKLKSSADMSSLFAGADDFGDLLEATGKIKKHGTTDEVSTKDRASEKQLAWEQNRIKGGRGGFGGKSRQMGRTTLKNKSHKRFK